MGEQRGEGRGREREGERFSTIKKKKGGLERCGNPTMPTKDRTRCDMFVYSLWFFFWIVEKNNRYYLPPSLAQPLLQQSPIDLERKEQGYVFFDKLLE